MVDLAGKTLGKYRLIEQLGRGGFASVYKAYHARLDRYVAIKVLHPHLVEGEDFLARFEREAKAVAVLRHPNIVMVHDFDVEDNIYYMVMEFIDGLSLKEKLIQLNTGKAYLSLADIRRIMEGVTSALDYAHDRGMLHRDIKPSNVILSTRGEAFLTDFGIARILSSTQFTATGALIGTPAYMSPEQGQGLAVSSASDVYSLGVMLYEFLTGHVPFDADTPLAIIFKHISDPLPSIHSIRPDLPEELERVIYKALAKDPGDRYQQPGEMMGALTGALTRMSQSETVFQAPKEAVAPEPAETVGLPPEPEELPETMVSGEPDFESEKAPTVAVDRSEEIPEQEIESLGEAAVLDEEPPDLAEFEEPTEVEVGEAVPTTGDLEPGDRQAGMDETGVPATGQAALTGPGKKRRRDSKWFWAAGILVVVLVVLGLSLSGILTPGSDREPDQVGVAATATIKPTRIPPPTSPPEPTEIPGMAAFEEGFVLLHNEGKYSEAIEKFNQAEEQGYTAPELYTHRAFACSENQFHFGECSYDIALRDFEQSFELDPDQAQLYELRGTYFEHIENWGRAIEDYSRAIELEPDNPGLWANRGSVYEEIGEFNNALSDINHAIELQPEDGGYYILRAALHRNVGDPQAAIEDLTRAIELDPGNPDVWWTRGWRYLEMERLEEAIADFTEAIRIASDALPAYVGRANAYARMGNFDGAIQDINAAIKLQPERDWLFLERARLFWWQIGDVDAAISDLDKAISLNPNNWEAFVNLGEIYTYELGDIDQGLHHFNQAVKVVPRGIEIPFMARGMFYNHVEDWEMAIEDLNLANRIMPENAEVYGHRGFAYQNLGLIDQARADYEIFLEMTQGNPEYEGWREEIESWMANNS